MIFLYVPSFCYIFIYLYMFLAITYVAFLGGPFGLLDFMFGAVIDRDRPC